MKEKTEKNITQLILYEREFFPSLRFMSVLDIFPCVLILSSLYLLINGILIIVEANAVISSSVILFSYVTMLFFASRRIGEIKSDRKAEFVLKSNEISAIFLLVLLLSTICLITLSCFMRESVYLSMAIISLTLYVGFAVSLEKLVDGDDESSIHYQLKKPFIDIGLNFKENKKTIFLAVLCTIIYIILYYAFLIIAAIAFILFIIVMVSARRRIKKFSENIIREFYSKKILILQIGPSNAITKIADEIFKKYCTVQYNSVVDLNKERYDVIIVFNTSKKHDEHITGVGLNNAILSNEGVIIDPFRRKTAKRSFWTAWFGFPVSSKRWRTMEAYMDLFKK